MPGSSRITGPRLLDFDDTSHATAPDGTKYMIQSEREHLRECRVWYFEIRRPGELWTGYDSFGPTFEIEGADRLDYGYRTSRQAAINMAERHAREFHSVSTPT